MSVLYFLLLVGVLVVIHELGHFAAAKLLDVKVLRFSFGYGRPLVRARALMGASLGCCPRPRGRSGCETTATTLWVDSRSASSVGTANEGVPKKTTRMGGGYHLPARVIRRIFRTMRSRLMPRSRSTNSVPSR